MEVSGLVLRSALAGEHSSPSLYGTKSGLDICFRKNRLSGLLRGERRRGRYNAEFLMT